MPVCGHVMLDHPKLWIASSAFYFSSQVEKISPKPVTQTQRSQKVRLLSDAKKLFRIFFSLPHISHKFYLAEDRSAILSALFASSQYLDFFLDNLVTSSLALRSHERL